MESREKIIPTTRTHFISSLRAHTVMLVGTYVAYMLHREIKSPKSPDSEYSSTTPRAFLPDADMAVSSSVGLRVGGH